MLFLKRESKIYVKITCNCRVPCKGKTISKYLGNEYIVKSSVGHIRDLPKGKSKAKRQNSIPKDASPEEKARLKKSKKEEG